MSRITVCLAMLALTGVACESTNTTGSPTDVPAMADAARDSSTTDAVPDDVRPEVLSGPTVKLSGVVYRFHSPDPVAEVVVSVAEFPELTTTSDDGGRFVLEVPDGVQITPFAAHPIYVTEYHQTFTTDGADLEKLYFQMVTPAVYDIFAQILQIVPDPGKCQIASTVNVKAIRAIDFEGFTTYGPHGIAGATADSEPPTTPVAYFDESTTPDLSLTESTIDGGVVWTNVDPGVYTFRAHHPDIATDSFVATCEPGRFINASPPWGLREL